MKRDRLTEIKCSEAGILTGDAETLEALRAGAMVEGKAVSAVALSYFGQDRENLVSHGVKRMPNVRNGKTGQVYLMGKQWRGDVEKGTLEDGTGVEFILAGLPVELRPRLKPAIPRMPAPLRDPVAWVSMGIYPGAPAEAFAFQIGLSHDPQLAKTVQDAVCMPLHGLVAALEGRVIFPDHAEGWTLPEGFKPFPCFHRAGQRGSFFAMGLNGAKSWKVWRKALQWYGEGSALAAWSLWRNIFDGIPIPAGLIEFLPEPDSPEFQCWEV